MNRMFRYAVATYIQGIKAGLRRRGYKAYVVYGQ